MNTLAKNLKNSIEKIKIQKAFDRSKEFIVLLEIPLTPSMKENNN